MRQVGYSIVSFAKSCAEGLWIITFYLTGYDKALVDQILHQSAWKTFTTHTMKRSSQVYLIFSLMCFIFGWPSKLAERKNVSHGEAVQEWLVQMAWNLIHAWCILMQQMFVQVFLCQNRYEENLRNNWRNGQAAWSMESDVKWCKVM